MPLDALALRVISKESRQLFYAAKQYEPVISETKAGDVPVPVAGSGIAAAAAAERASAAAPLACLQLDRIGRDRGWMPCQTNQTERAFLKPFQIQTATQRGSDHPDLSVETAYA